MKKIFSISLLFVVMFIGVGCGAATQSLPGFGTPQPTQTPKPTENLSVMPTTAPSRTPTLGPTATAKPTDPPTATNVPPTATSAPTNTPAPTAVQIVCPKTIAEAIMLVQNTNKEQLAAYEKQCGSLAKPTTTANTALPGPTLSMTGKLFLSPVKATSTFNKESAWLIAEPGRICSPECPWTLLAIDTTYAGNAAEGGFLYISAGQLNMVVDGLRFELPYQDGNNNIVLIRGRPDDGKIDTDLNTTIQLTSFKPGHGIYTMIPVGAYVSKDWFRDQLKISMNVEKAGTSWSNCGALGCSKTTILLVDVGSHGYQKFIVYAKNIDDWSLLETNMN